MPRRLLSREDRAEVLALKRRERLSFSELAEQIGFRVGTLRVWARRARALEAPARSPRFVEVEVRGATVTSGFEVEVAGGRVVRVRPDSGRRTRSTSDEIPVRKQSR